MKKIRKRIIQVFILLAIGYLLLLIPDADNKTIFKAGNKPFAWNKDSLWLSLENNFKEARLLNPQKLDSDIHSLFEKETFIQHKIEQPGLPSADKNLDTLLSDFFSLASLIAARPAMRDSFSQFYINARNTIKLQSRHWDINEKNDRNRIYTLLYGMRAAVEEVLLQSDSMSFKPAMICSNEYSETPFTNIFGIKVHSGDLLVSRGGTEVSALISRGNDYPGNFSHVALIYIDEVNHIPYLIESHIEKGVAFSSVEQYVKDKKLRFMVLRPSADLPKVKNNPLLPQQAAKYAFDEANSRHIPYDFKMNFYDSSAMFCSEVASYAYRKNGVQLWQGVSTISSQGVVNWLHVFGVENFVTQMPSDLEYDPQLSVVAEWRGPETLFKDHIDNAVTDALLELADNGKQISYNKWMLPFVRIIKGWCLAKNYFGKIGVIPEGMSATQALKNQSYVAMFKKVKNKTEQSVSKFETENKYKPPYWEILSLARNAALEER